ncbi:hypothetical protein DYB32_009867 [Aphanomyces invadans]|uniref:PH domain-containing protein n=1 Tax=Aphanomyces invadans TaxID=157072 RepID=A0A418AHE2_9STRA|nr:hypothetical protein DYB32_009867 [Aphanomyces invadans]
MGHAISKAVKQKGKKAENPSWSGWIYLVKATWNRRYCRITDDKLYYFRDDSPSKGSRGWVSFLDMLAIVHLPFRHSDSTADVGKTSVVPFLLLTSTSTFIVGFATAAEKHEFADHLAAHHRIPVMPVVTEDWSIVQLNLSTKAMPPPSSSSASSSKPFQRLYLVFVGSGDLLFFAEGSILMDVVFRVRMLDMVNVVVEYDGAAGNGLVARLSPRSKGAMPTASPLDGPTIDIILPMDKAVRLEFDALPQYEKWRELLVDALEGDYTGSQFCQRQVVAARRKQVHRQQKLDAMKKKKKKQQQQQGRRHHFRASSAAAGRPTDVASESDDGSMIRDSMSRTASSVEYSECSGAALSEVDNRVDEAKALVRRAGASVPAKDGPSTVLPTKPWMDGADVPALDHSSATMAHQSTKAKRNKTTAATMDIMPPPAPHLTLHHGQDPATIPSKPPMRAPNNLPNEAPSDPRHEVLVDPRDLTVPSETTGQPMLALVGSGRRLREDLFASPRSSHRPSIVAAQPALVPASTFESKRASLLARLHHTSPATTYSPLSPKVQIAPSTVATTTFPAVAGMPISPRWLPAPAAAASAAVSSSEAQPPPPPPPRYHRRPSITSEAVQHDRQYRHRMLQQDFEKLQKSLLADDPKRAKRLARVIKACARAIDTLGALAMHPPEASSDNNTILPPQWTLPRSDRVVSGNWFTTDAPGGRRVRHWQPRQSRQ